MKVSQLKLNKKNPRKISPEQLEKLMRSIESFPEMMKINNIKTTYAVIGSRSVNANIDHILSERISKHDTIISGGAIGIDTMAAEWANANGISTIVIKPNYAVYGKKAPLIRNKEIALACDTMIAIWDGKSKGTLNAINHAKKAGKHVEIIRV